MKKKKDDEKKINHVMELSDLYVSWLGVSSSYLIHCRRMGFTVLCVGTGLRHVNYLDRLMLKRSQLLASGSIWREKEATA